MNLNGALVSEPTSAEMPNGMMFLRAQLWCCGLELQQDHALLDVPVGLVVMTLHL